ncbi:MAG TPA: hypothetical protein VE398_21210 [Acidobacteriota bacterium]|nr:hypothetical protein [Acidobacteriota bacterium]
MELRTGRSTIAALILVLVSSPIRAQERKLGEADIQKLIPVLQAEGTTLAAGQTTADRMLAARSGISGDPLEYFRSRGKFDPPEGARYVAPCSRAAGAGGPVAIFTFGRNIDCYHRTWRDYARNLKGSPDTMPAPCRTEGESTVKFLQQAQGVLEKRGFEVVMEGDSSRELASTDGIFRILLYPHNVYDRSNRPDDHLLIVIEDEKAREGALAACSNMPSGPILVLLPGGAFFAGEASGDLEAALRKAGLKADEYEALKGALFLARMDVETGAFQAAEAVAGNDPAERQALAVRRSNADLYRKHASELKPLLDRLIPR